MREARSYSAKVIANFFLQRLQHVNPMKLQRLVYYAHGAVLAILDRPLINEPIQAQEYSPIIGTLHFEFRSYGMSPIDRLAVTSEAEIDTEDAELLQVLNACIVKFAALSSEELTYLTHHEGDAYMLFRASKAVGLVIPDTLIKSAFKERFLAEDRTFEFTAAVKNHITKTTMMMPALFVGLVFLVDQERKVLTTKELRAIRDKVMMKLFDRFYVPWTRDDFYISLKEHEKYFKICDRSVELIEPLRTKDHVASYFIYEGSQSDYYSLVVWMDITSAIASAYAEVLSKK